MIFKSTNMPQPLLGHTIYRISQVNIMLVSNHELFIDDQGAEVAAAWFWNRFCFDLNYCSIKSFVGVNFQSQFKTCFFTDWELHRPEGYNLAFWIFRRKQQWAASVNKVDMVLHDYEWRWRPNTWSNMNQKNMIGNHLTMLPLLTKS